jgi:hypothetical protein
MKPRVLTLIFGLVGLLLTGVISVSFAYSYKNETPKSPKQKNEVIFNWGSSS